MSCRKLKLKSCKKNKFFLKMDRGSVLFNHNHTLEFIQVIQGQGGQVDLVNEMIK